MAAQKHDFVKCLRPRLVSPLPRLDARRGGEERIQGYMNWEMRRGARNWSSLILLFICSFLTVTCKNTSAASTAVRLMTSWSTFILSESTGLALKDAGKVQPPVCDTRLKGYFLSSWSFVLWLTGTQKSWTDGAWTLPLLSCLTSTQLCSVIRKAWATRSIVLSVVRARKDVCVQNVE